MMGGGAATAQASELELAVVTVNVYVAAVLRRCGCTRYELMRGVYELRFDLDLDNALDAKLKAFRPKRRV